MRLFVLLAGLALAGCATPCATAITQASTRTLTCEDGSRLVVTFNPTPNPAHVEQAGYAPLDLGPVNSASGYRFVQGGAELRGTLGGEALWTRPGAAETECREVPPDAVTPTR
jgi:hypothetical protein